MTELLWDGKYLAGKKVAPVRISLPFQTIETVNETAQDRQRSLELFSTGREAAWRNRLIWGDKKYVLPSLLPELTGKVNLIYIDPPFDTGQDFSYTATVPDLDDPDQESASFVKEPSILEQKAYRDTWGRGQDSYVNWMYETLVLLRDLLAETGSIYVHLDVHRGPYVKILMDEVFGIENFRNEIAWYYYNKLHDSRKKLLPKAFDQILYYVKSKESNYTYHALKEKRDNPVTKLKYRKVDGKIQNVIGEDGKAVTYVSEERTVDNVWRIRCLQPANKAEWVNYDTQKPVDLIERILSISSNPGDLVLDCFCGSGSSLIAAERLGRRWIGCDLGRFAVHMSRKRLLSIPNVQPFAVQNLGRYERQAWQAAEFAAPGDLGEREALYRAFILDLYRATPVTGHTWLHGMKNSRMVHVGAVDAPVTLTDVKAIAAELWRSVGSGKDTPGLAAVDVLGWEFAFELNELARQVAAEARVDVTFKKIPREVLEKRAVEQGDIRFFELAALALDVKSRKNKVTLKLTDFTIPPDDVPEEVQKAIKNWSQYIDYWAVDWNYKGDTFHNQWQSYRTRGNPKLQTAAEYQYDEPGTYTVVVKVIDILGNDTTKALEVKVA